MCKIIKSKPKQLAFTKYLFKKYSLKNNIDARNAEMNKEFCYPDYITYHSEKETNCGANKML